MRSWEQGQGYCLTAMCFCMELIKGRLVTANLGYQLHTPGKTEHQLKN